MVNEMNKTLGTDSIAFMRDLWKNNSKIWFDQNRERYINSVREPMKTLAESLAGPMGHMNAEFCDKPKISRINSDIRFHKDKPPYKEHVWIKFGGPNSEMFAAISHKGWEAGCSLASQKREDMEIWRYNLINHIDLWRRYWKVLTKKHDVCIHFENSYKKPLYDNIPDDVYDFVQARSLYIWGKEKQDFPQAAETMYLHSLARMLPIYLFMTVHSNELEDRLKELVNDIGAPEEPIQQLWEVFNY